MATPMHTIADNFNFNTCTTTTEQDLTNITAISDTNAIITPIKMKRLPNKTLLDFMYPKQTHYPTDLFWTDPQISMVPIVPPRPLKQQPLNNTNVAPPLPPRPHKALSLQSANDNPSQPQSNQSNDTNALNADAGQPQQQFIRNMINQIISKSITDVTSTTTIIEQTRGTIAKTQYYKNPNIRDDSNNVVKPNYKNRYI